MKRRISCTSSFSSSPTRIVLRVDTHSLSQELQRRLLEVALTFRARKQLQKSASVLAAGLNVVAAADEVEETTRRGRQQREEERRRNARDASRGKRGSLALEEPTRWKATP